MTHDIYLNELEIQMAIAYWINSQYTNTNFDASHVRVQYDREEEYMYAYVRKQVETK